MRIAPGPLFKESDRSRNASSPRSNLAPRSFPVNHRELYHMLDIGQISHCFLCSMSRTCPRNKPGPHNLPCAENTTQVKTAIPNISFMLATVCSKDTNKRFFRKIYIGKNAAYCPVLNAFQYQGWTRGPCESAPLGSHNGLIQRDIFDVWHRAPSSRRLDRSGDKTTPPTRATRSDSCCALVTFYHHLITGCFFP